MLVIRMQRTGRKGHAMFRVVVQDSQRTPTSGKVVARLGSYDPHGKVTVLDKEKAAFYLEHGAQPSDRVARLLKSEGVKLPDWVRLPAKKERTVRNADKRRSTRPDEPVVEAPAAAEEAAPAAEEAPADEPAPAEEAPATEAESTEEAAPAEAEEPAEASEPEAKEEPAAESTETEEPAEAAEESPEPAAEEAPAETAEETPAEDQPAEDEKAA
jgi:small subunit ribosomal protein S16